VHGFHGVRAYRTSAASKSLEHEIRPSSLKLWIGFLGHPRALRLEDARRTVVGYLSSNESAAAPPYRYFDSRYQYQVRGAASCSLAEYGEQTIYHITQRQTRPYSLNGR
jgi:hypothetical protein